MSEASDGKGLKSLLSFRDSLGILYFLLDLVSELG